MTAPSAPPPGALLPESLLLSAMIADPAATERAAAAGITDEHFRTPALRQLYAVLVRYHDATGGTPTGEVLAAMLARHGTDSGTGHLLVALHTALASRSTTADQLAWSMAELIDARAAAATEAALTRAMGILKRGEPDPEHPGDPDALIKGQLAARETLTVALSEIARQADHAAAPEGALGSEAAEILAEYAARATIAASHSEPGIGWGIPAVDERTGGLMPGELAMAVGYSGAGKSSLVVQLAHHASTAQGRGVVIFTTETLRDTVRRRLVARHSRHPRFGIPDGFDSHDLRRGTLPAHQLARLPEVVADLTGNPDYGPLYICQVPRGATIELIEAHAHRIRRSQPVALIVIDYLGLLRGSRRRSSSREELAETIKEAKALATTFDHGTGAAVVSPWQVNRSGYESGQAAGGYDSTVTAETSEATNSADILLSILATGEQTGRRTEALMQVLKNRDGPLAQFPVEIDRATCHFAPLARAAATASPMGMSGFDTSTLLGMAVSTT